MPSMMKAPLPFAPHRCLVTSSEDGDLLDFGDVNVNEPVFRLYLQRGVIEEAARECCGMVSSAEVAEIRQRMEELTKQLDQALVDVSLLDEFEARFGKELEAGVTAGINIEPSAPAGEGTGDTWHPRT